MPAPHNVMRVIVPLAERRPENLPSVALHRRAVLARFAWQPRRTAVYRGTRDLGCLGNDPTFPAPREQGCRTRVIL